jgi:glycosyltransferase involved in cell wall biosynthesis
MAAAGRYIVYDGFNLALAQGTGIATYARVLTGIARELGHEVGIVYGSPQTPPRAALSREIAFFDAPQAIKISRPKAAFDWVVDQVRYWRPVKPQPINLSGTVVTRHFAATLPAHDRLFAARNLFFNAECHFAQANAFANLAFERRPDIFHCTYQLPLRVKSACNVYTIHDLVPLRLPFTTLDNKRYMLRLLRKIAAEADHIVTVSENSKRDIIELLGVDERRVTNTYQSVTISHQDLERSETEIGEQLAGSFGLDLHDYLLFFGALEPKKNVRRLVDAYLSSGVHIPMVLVAGEGWQSDPEVKFLASLQANDRSPANAKRRVQRLDYVTSATLVSLVRGARAVVFPSLYEGFGLPVLEAMTLGTPVITSHEAALPEVAGDAACLVDPYDTTAIARAIATIVADADLRAELSRRGRIQAEKFSRARYRERVDRLYASLC